MNEIKLEELIEDYNFYKKNVVIALEELSNLFRNGKIEQALNGVMNFSEGVNWLIKVHEYFVISNIQSTLDKDKIINMLNEINEALEEQDFFLTADIFEYDVKEFLKELKDVSQV